MMKTNHALFHVSSENGGGPMWMSVGARGGGHTAQPLESQ